LSTSARHFLALARPAHWIKNVVVLAGPAAGMKLITADGALRSLVAFAAFCLASSGIYAINDAIDARADAEHPTKRHRPVARGAVRPLTAVVFGLALLAAAGLIVMMLPISARRNVAAVLALYALLTIAYSMAIKEWIILDVIVISIGFVLRAWAGSLAVEVPTSEWLVACVFTLCLFMGFGKRRCELVMIGGSEPGRHRNTLIHYTPDLLNHLITVSAGIAVMTFLLYTMDTTGSPPPFPKQQLFFTLPLVVYGVFRFAMVTELGLYTGPTEIVLKDRPMLAAIVIWALISLLIAYQFRWLGPEGFEGLLRGFTARPLATG